MRKRLIEISNSYRLPNLLLTVIFTAFMLGFGIYRSKSYTLRDSLDYYGLIIESILPLFFPALVVLIFVTSFAGEIKHRFLVYTRTRRPILETLKIKQQANIIITFIVFFLMIFIPFIYVFYIDPMMGKTVFYPEYYNLTKENITQDTYNRHTFTNFLEYGKLIFGLTYSTWVGINACLYAAITFQLVLLTRNTLLALSIPFIAYVVGSFTLSALKLQAFQPNQVVFPLGHSQEPIWTSLLYITILLSILIVLNNLTKQKYLRGDES
ncbi:hypothetical protein [Paenibacillus amylolyticus]|uniref:hypothetical protein n=1 Tax=Paenibacillus amylolyticus TaxID=1451 RepID=UPI003EBE41CC